MSMNFGLPSGVTKQFSKTTPKKSPNDTFKDIRNGETKDTFKDIKNGETKDAFGAAKKSLFNGELTDAEKDPKKLMAFAEKHLQEKGGKGKIDGKLDKEEVRTLLGDNPANNFDQVWADGGKQQNSKGLHLIDDKSFFKMYHDLNG